jgi:predicted transcriptional regulator
MVFMGIDMTCIDLSVKDLLKCSYGLSKREAAVLLRLLGAGAWAPISRIAAQSGRDRSVLQRALFSLVKKGVVEREQRNRAGGGYEYLYRAKDKAAVKRAIREKSRHFCRMVDEAMGAW